MLQRLQPTEELRLEVLDSAASLRAIAREWDDLWRRSDVTMPTVCDEPAATWLDTFARNGDIRIVTLRSGERLVAALPLAERKLARFVAVGDLTLNPWSPNGELLVDADFDLDELADHLARAVCGLPWPLLWLEMVPYESDRWARFAHALARHGARVDIRPGFSIGRVSLRQPFETYFAGRSKNLRRSIRRDSQRLDAALNAEFRLLDTLGPDDVEPILRQAFAIEDSGWKGRAGTSVLRNDGIFDFYLRMARWFAQKEMLRVAMLQCHGSPIAFELGWRAKGVYHSFKIGYDERFRQYGPGHLLRHKLIESGCSDPALRYVDFQGPINDALRPWSTETYAIGRVAICPPRLRSRTLWTGLRAARKLAGTFRLAAP